MMGFGRLVEAEGDGTIRLRLGTAERELVRTLVPQLRELLEEDAEGAGPPDPLVARLFPTAVPDDEEADRSYRAMVGDDLLAGRLANLDLLERTVDDGRLDRAEADRWMRAVNELRLVLGTRLDVSEDDDPPELDSPDAGLYAAYAWLGVLLEDLVSVLSSLPPDDPRDDPVDEGG